MTLGAWLRLGAGAAHAPSRRRATRPSALAGGDKDHAMVYRISAVETGTALVATATVFPVPYPGPCVARAVGKYRPLVGDDPGLIGRSCRCPRLPACSTAPAVAVRWRSVATATAAIVTAARTAPRRRGGTSGRAAGARYQRSRPGRMNHAHRQRRYRTRRRKVTHQGSLAPPPGGSLSPESRASAPPPTSLRERLPLRVCAVISAGGSARPLSVWGSCASAAMGQ